MFIVTGNGDHGQENNNNIRVAQEGTKEKYDASSYFSARKIGLHSTKEERTKNEEETQPQERNDKGPSMNMDEQKTINFQLGLTTNDQRAAYFRWGPATNDQRAAYFRWGPATNDQRAAYFWWGPATNDQRAAYFRWGPETSESKPYLQGIIHMFRTN
jgi:hypothetical protein